MEEKILEIMENVLKISREKLLANFDSNEIWDSLTRVEILFEMEEEFDVFFEAEELAVLVTPRLLCEAAIGKAE